MAISAVITLIALVLLVGIAVFVLPASIRHERQTDDGRFDQPLHRFDDYDEHPAAGGGPKNRTSGHASNGFFGFTADGASSSDCGTSGGGDGGGSS